MDPLEPDTGALEEEEVDDKQQGRHHHRNCLLCYKAISKEESALAPVLTNDLNEQNFNSVFILRKMLNVPKERLVGYLKDFGCPGKWVEYCKNCLYLVDAALRIQKEISELEDKLRKCQEHMVQKIKSTCKKNPNNSSVNSGITRITEETRQLINFGKPPYQLNDKDTPEISSDVEDYNEVLESVSVIPSHPVYLDLGVPEERPTKVLNLQSTEEGDINQMYSNSLINGNYSCAHCPTIPKNMSFLQIYSHLIFHSQRPFKCSICNIYWSSVKELEKNPFKKEDPSNLEHVCSEETLVKIAGASGVEDGKLNGGKIWTCEWCPDLEKFDTEKERDLHEEEYHSSLKNSMEISKYKCLSCSKAYRSFREWLLHRVLEHPRIAATSCLYCDYSAVVCTKEDIDILNLKDMKSHVTSQHPACINRFTYLETCDFCGLTFESTGQGSKHFQQMHHLNSLRSKYSCPCCYERYGRRNEMRNHLILKHSQNPSSSSNLLPPNKRIGYCKKNYKICDICGNRLKSFVTLVDHKMVKHGVDPEAMEEYNGQEILKCERADECGGFRALVKETMRQHMMKKHGTERRWKCEICGKGFTESNKLKRHKDIHGNKEKRPYQCEICGNSFAVKNYLYIHMRLSHQNKPFASTNRKRSGKNGATERKFAKMSQPPQNSVETSASSSCTPTD